MMSGSSASIRLPCKADFLQNVPWIHIKNHQSIEKDKEKEKCVSWCCIPLLFQLVIHKNRRPKSSTSNLFHDLVLVHSWLHESEKIKATLKLLFPSTSLPKFVYLQSVHEARSPSPTTTKCRTDLQSTFPNPKSPPTIPTFWISTCFSQMNNENKQRY